MKLLGNRILIQLDKEDSNTTLPSGIEVPFVKFEETDGGKLKARVTNEPYLAQGTVIDISDYALKLLKDEGYALAVGDRVLVNPMSVSPNYQFFTDRSSKVLLFDGKISIPTSHLEAII
mgnify:CR=1 FL=1